MSDSENSFSVKARNMSALAALCVIVIHAGGEGMGSFAAKVMNHVFGWGLCTFAVPWFFFASGYFFAGHLEEKGWWLRSIRSRLRTLVIPYVVWCSLYACFAAGIEICRSLEVGRAAMTGMSWRWFLVQGLGLDVSHHPLLVPLWYVRCLLIIVLLSPALVWALRRARLVDTCCHHSAIRVLLWIARSLHDAVVSVLQHDLACGLAVFFHWRVGAARALGGEKMLRTNMGMLGGGTCSDLRRAHGSLLRDAEGGLVFLAHGHTSAFVGSLAACARPSLAKVARHGGISGVCDALFL